MTSTAIERSDALRCALDKLISKNPQSENEFVEQMKQSKKHTINGQYIVLIRKDIFKKPQNAVPAPPAPIEDVVDENVLDQLLALVPLEVVLVISVVLVAHVALPFDFFHLVFCWLAGIL